MLFKFFFFGVLVLASLITTSLAHESHDSDGNSNNSSKNTSSAIPYTLVADYSDSNFFDGFVTFTGPDPTNGKVNYTDMAFAASQDYLSYTFYEKENMTRARIGVDSVESSPMRNSVRLTSRATFSAGTLLVADINHIPVGPSLWPAFWLLGTDSNKTGAKWPAQGEIDILEYVHDTPYNAMALHTAPGCSVDNAMTSFTGQLQDPDCNAASATKGCSIHAPANLTSLSSTFASAGHAFNSQGGAVYVTEWTPQGIKIWAFARSSVPESLNSDHPSTASFPTPLASFAGAGCDFEEAFKDMVLIINTDFCGDWAGKVWRESGAEKATGMQSCEAYVEGNTGVFEEAYWEISSVKVYSNGRLPGRNVDVGGPGFTA